MPSVNPPHRQTRIHHIPRRLFSTWHRFSSYHQRQLSRLPCNGTEIRSACRRGHSRRHRCRRTPWICKRRCRVTTACRIASTIRLPAGVDVVGAYGARADVTWGCSSRWTPWIRERWSGVAAAGWKAATIRLPARVEVIDAQGARACLDWRCGSCWTTWVRERRCGKSAASRIAPSIGLAAGVDVVGAYGTCAGRGVSRCSRNRGRTSGICERRRGVATASRETSAVCLAARVEVIDTSSAGAGRATAGSCYWWCRRRRGRLGYAGEDSQKACGDESADGHFGSSSVLTVLPACGLGSGGGVEAEYLCFPYVFVRPSYLWLVKRQYLSIAKLTSQVCSNRYE